MLRHGCFALLDNGIGIVATLAAQVYGGEAIDWHVVGGVHIDETHHVLVGAIGLEADLLPYPLGTLLGNGTLREFVTKLDLELGTIQVALSVQTWDIEFPFLFIGFLGNECRGSEDETQFINILESCFQLLKSIDGKARSRNGHLAAIAQFFYQI